MKTAARGKAGAAESEAPTRDREDATVVGHQTPDTGALIRRYVGAETEGPESEGPETEGPESEGPETESAETETETEAPEPQVEVESEGAESESTESAGTEPESETGEVDASGRTSIMSEGYGVPGESEEHHAEVVIDGDEVYGVLHSKPKTIAAIFKALLRAGVRPRMISTQQRRYRNACRILVSANQDLRTAQGEARGLPRKDPAHVRVLRARRAVSTATDSLLRLCRRLHVELWDAYPDALAAYLMPASVLSRPVGPTGTFPINQYRSGHDPANAIPLVWYKPEAAYPRVRYYDGPADAWVTVNRFQGFTVTGKDNLPYTFGVPARNRPSAFIATGAQRLRKVAHDGDRGWQQWYNKVLVHAEVRVETTPGSNRFKPFSSGDFDGDHVRDLGFGGTDTIDNYWPLDPAVNRRAFTGYNGFYKLNYLERSRPTSGFDTRAAMRLGGMIGKYFYIKGWMPPTGAAAEPAESGSTHAGHVV